MSKETMEVWHLENTGSIYNVEGIIYGACYKKENHIKEEIWRDLRHIVAGEDIGYTRNGETELRIRREFFTYSYEGFIALMKEISKTPEKMTWHEILRSYDEDSPRPNKIVLDIEGSSKFALETFKDRAYFMKKVVCGFYLKELLAFVKKYDKDVTIDDFIVQDSYLETSPTGFPKFSAHITFFMGGVKRNQCYVPFMKEFIRYLHLQKQKGCLDDYDYFLVDGDVKKFFVDMRTFDSMRMMFNIKPGPKIPLRHYDHKLQKFRDDIKFDENLFRDSLLTYFPPKKKPYVVFDVHPNKETDQIFDKIQEKFGILSNKKRPFRSISGDMEELTTEMIHTSHSFLKDHIARYYKTYLKHVDTRQLEFVHGKIIDGGQSVRIDVRTKGDHCLCAVVKHRRRKEHTHKKKGVWFWFMIENNFFYQECYSTECQKQTKLSLKLDYSK